MKILQVASFLCVFLSRCFSGRCPKPAKEGSSYTFEHTSLAFGAEIVLAFRLNTREIPYINCDTAPPSCPTHGKISKTNGVVSMSVTVDQVKRMHETSWTFRDKAMPPDSCDLKVYYVDTKPVCRNITFNPDKTKLTWKCSISKMYPQPLCLFKYKKDGGDFTNTVSPDYVTYTTPTAFSLSSPQPDLPPPVYYSGNCTMNLPLNTLGPGTYTFKVFMYPNLTNVTPDNGTTSESAPIQLKLPVPKLKDCPKGDDVKDGYIKAGTTATCQCTLQDDGHPTGTLEWQNSNNNVVQQGDTLTVSYNKIDTNPTYKCVGKSVLIAPATGQHVENYTPQFAYGPTMVSTSLHGNNDYFDFCRTTDHFEMVCSTPFTSFNPSSPKCSFEGEADIIAVGVQEETSVHTCRYNVMPKGAGALALKCVVSNRLFPGLKAEQERTIIIRTPPKSPPVMTVNGNAVTTGDSLTVTSGDSLDITCSVSGGFPAVSQVTISCNSDNRVADGTPPTRTLIVDKTMNGETCVCTAQHITGCYDELTEFTLDVQYGPTTVSMGLNGNIDTFNVCGPTPATANFDMYCDTLIDGVNPKPISKVEGNAKPTFVYMEEFNGYYRFHYTIIPSVGGILTLKCVVFNSVIPRLKAEQDKAIKIQIPPPSPPVMTVNGNTVTTGGRETVNSGDSLDIKCLVSGGYPAVSQVTIYCGGDNKVADGTPPTRTLIVDKVMNGEKCVCTAQHASGCYTENTQEFTLDVKYTPTFTNFKADNEPTSLEVDAEDKVNLTCEAEGNPRPTVSVGVGGQGSNELLSLQDQSHGDYTKIGTIKKPMKCKDTGTYVCTARNGVGSGISKNLTVFVKCTPEIPVPPKETEYKPTNASDLVITIDIIGHPKPTNFSLTKIGNGGTRRKRSVTVTVVDENSYNVTYIAGVPPEGMVVLRMFGLLDDDRGEYELTIMNGVGDGLKYRYNVTIVPAESGVDSSSMGLVIGAAVGAVVVIIIIIVIVILVLRRKGLPPFRKADPHRKMREREEAEEQMESHNMNDIYGDGMPGKKGGASNNLDPDAVAVRDHPPEYDPTLRESNIAQYDNAIYESGKDTDAVVTRDQPARYDPTLRDSNLGQFDNVMYNGDIDTEVEMIPNEIYGMDRKAYTDYNEVKTTITSAMAVPKNLKTLSGSPPPYDDNDNPYEDFKENDTSKLQTQPPSHSKPTALKPSVPNKPKPSKNKKPPNDNAKVAVEQQPQNTFGLAGNEESVYSEVVKKPAGKPLIPKAVVVDKADDLDDLGLPDQAKAPSVPDKNFEKPAKPQVPSKPGHKTSDKNDAPASNNHGYTNLGMDYNEGDTVPEDDNVYGNSGVDTPGTYTNQNGLQYSLVELVPNARGGMFKVAQDGVSYSTVSFDHNS